jgi:hypothetical protein
MYRNQKLKKKKSQNPLILTNFRILFTPQSSFLCEKPVNWCVGGFLGGKCLASFREHFGGIEIEHYLSTENIPKFNCNKNAKQIKE